VRDTVELLKSAELVDYFQDDCVNLLRSKTAGIEQISPTAAIIYLIPLPDRTELLLGTTEGLKRFSIAVGEPQLTAVIRAFRRNSKRARTYEYLTKPPALRLARARPWRARSQHGIDTLVFVPMAPCGRSRSPPCTTRQNFLINRYAVAVTPERRSRTAHRGAEIRAALVRRALRCGAGLSAAGLCPPGARQPSGGSTAAPSCSTNSFSPTASATSFAARTSPSFTSPRTDHLIAIAHKTFVLTTIRR